MGNLLPIVRVSGLMLVLFSLTYTLPILTALAYRDGTAALFIEAMLLTSGSDGVLWLATRQFERELRTRDGLLLAVLGWIGMAALVGIANWASRRAPASAPAVSATALCAVASRRVRRARAATRAVGCWAKVRRAHCALGQTKRRTQEADHTKCGRAIKASEGHSY